MTQQNPSSSLKAPAWGEELSVKYLSNISHAFLLHGNTRDYVGGIPGQTLKNYLVESFRRDYDAIVVWNRAAGFWLPTEAQRQLFAKLIDLPLPAGTPGSLPAQGPQRTLGGRAGGGSSGLGSSLAAGLNQAVSSPASDLAAQLAKIRNPLDAIDALSRAFHSRKPVDTGRGNTSSRRPAETNETLPRLAVILEYAESLAPATDSAPGETDRSILVVLSEWARDPQIGSRNHLLIAITDEIHELHERLRRSSASWEQIRLPLPHTEERVTFLRTLIEDQSYEVHLPADLSYEEVARLTTGLRYIDLEDIMLRASFHHQDLTRELVKARKDEILASEFDDVLALADNDFGFEAIGGMEEVKADLMETVVIPMRAGDLRVVPQGLLFMGPAGTGKTRLTRALAKESGVTFVELQPSRIFSKWVGDTERKLERALSAIRAMTPCIVFIDEIDQAVGRGESSDNGVSNRVFKRLMEIMSDTAWRGKILWVAATNRADLLDAALLRPGRLDKKIPILAPDADERTIILRVLTQEGFKQEETGWPSEEEYQHLALQMEGYTGAEIEMVVGKAVQLRTRHQQSRTIAEALIAAYERIIPSTQNVEEMTRLALLHCNDLDLVPAHLRELARELRHPASRRQAMEQEEQDAHRPPQARRTRRDNADHLSEE